MIRACDQQATEKAMSHTNLLYHIVFATKERAPLITNELRLRLHEYLGGIIRGLEGLPIEITRQRLQSAA